MRRWGNTETQQHIIRGKMEQEISPKGFFGPNRLKLKSTKAFGKVSLPGREFANSPNLA